MDLELLVLLMEQGRIYIKKQVLHFDSIICWYRITTYEAIEHKNNSPNDEETGRDLKIPSLF